MAVLTIPFIVRGLGIDRFGVQTLVWAIIGYFSLFDLGLGRTLTKMVADKLALSAFAEIPPLFWTTLALMFVLGLVGGAVIALSTEWLVTSFLKVPAALHRETIHTLWLLAAGIPIVILTSGLRGVMEAQQKFFGISVLRFFLGIYIYVTPLLVLMFTNDLAVITAVLVLGRIALSAAHFILCVRSMPSLLSRVRVSRATIKPLLSMGGWITVSNVLGPIMANLDRFFIGALVSMAAVAYYATPFEMVTKILLVPAALAGVLFPAFAAGFQDRRERIRSLFIRGGKYVLLAVFPGVLLLVAYAREILQLWLGSDFSANSFAVMQWLAIGILVNSLAQIPFAFLQAIGRADLTAKVHVAEIPVYLILFFGLTREYGIFGTALAWTFRVCLDAFILFALSAQFLQLAKREVGLVVFVIFLTVAIAAFFTLTLGPLSKILLAGMALVAFVLAVWLRLLDSEERVWIKLKLSRSVGR